MSDEPATPTGPMRRARQRARNARILTRKARKAVVSPAGLKGTAIEFSFTTEAQGQSIDVVYKGTVDGKTMKGAVAMAGGQLSGTFSGTRK